MSTFASMEPCPSGTYSLAGEQFCTLSEVGKYAIKTTEASQACGARQHADFGSTTCSDCLAGWDCKDNSGRHNVLCPPGHYYDKAVDGCTQCEAGKFCPTAIGGYRPAGIDCVDGTFSL